MLSKPVGPTGLYPLSATTGTYVASRDDGGVPMKVRVAVTQPAVINFGLGSADNNSDLLMPAGHVEHFTLPASTSTISYVLLSGATTGSISITTVA
jgi:hypothetical protein